MPWAFFAAELGKWVSSREQPKSQKMKVLTMAYSIMENVSTARESIFKLFPATQSPYRAKKRMDRTSPTHLFINIFPIFPRVGGMGGALEILKYAQAALCLLARSETLDMP